MSNAVTITGNLGQDPELRFIASGAAVCTISVGDTPRRKNPDTNQWEDSGETLWLRCTIWREAAEAVAEHLRKGDRVTVVGRLKARSWEDKDGSKRSVIECDADSVAKVVKAAPAARQQGGAGTPVGADPWARPAPVAAGGWGRPSNDEPPF